mmetsp:Transcript_13607/g.28736  ORF Transcript_13607/g.28736 Transcript_13607/m.28736 type:complete len:249 (-) Transcript_13607:79-825(-)
MLLKTQRRSHLLRCMRPILAPAPLSRRGALGHVPVHLRYFLQRFVAPTGGRSGDHGFPSALTMLNHVSEIVMFVVRVPLLVIVHVVFDIVGKEEGVVIDFAEPLGPIGVMLVDVHPRPPHLLPYVPTDLLFLLSASSLVGFEAIVPRAGHVDENDVFGEGAGREGRVVEVSPVGVVGDFIAFEFAADDGVGEEVDGVAALAPRGHDGVVHFFVPDEGDHAVDSVVGVVVADVVVVAVVAAILDVSRSR